MFQQTIYRLQYLVEYTIYCSLHILRPPLFLRKRGINMIAVIDYDAGNLKSVEKAFESLGFETKVTREKKELMRAEKVVLPGVGSFGDAMANLRKYEMDRVIKDIVAEKKPFLGICLGLQLLFEHSEESPGVEGLGILKGAGKSVNTLKCRSSC